METFKISAILAQVESKQVGHKVAILCPHCGKPLNPYSIMGQLGKGKRRALSDKQRRLRKNQLARVRKRRWLLRKAGYGPQTVKLNEGLSGPVPKSADEFERQFGAMAAEFSEVSGQATVRKSVSAKDDAAVKRDQPGTSARP